MATLDAVSAADSSTDDGSTGDGSTDMTADATDAASGADAADARDGGDAGCDGGTCDVCSGLGGCNLGCKHGTSCTQACGAVDDCRGSCDEATCVLTGGARSFFLCDDSFCSFVVGPDSSVYCDDGSRTCQVRCLGSCALSCKNRCELDCGSGPKTVGAGSFSCGDD